jgi:hypothetical protein
MLRRNLRHMLRYPGMTISVVAFPVIFLLLFLYVLGGALGAGLSRTDHGHYIGYLAPGIIVLAVSSASISTAVAVNTDMTKGIINRFRTMAIARGSVLTGHVVGSVLQTVISTAVVSCVTVALGFRPAVGADFGPSSGHGFTVLEPVADRTNRKVIKSSIRFGKDVHLAFLRHTPITISNYYGHNGYIFRTDLAGLNLTTMPKVLIECGNMNNRADAKLLTSLRVQREIAWALAQAIIRFLHGH